MTTEVVITALVFLGVVALTWNRAFASMAVKLVILVFAIWFLLYRAGHGHIVPWEAVAGFVAACYCGSKIKPGWR